MRGFTTRPGDTAQDSGRKFESFFAKLLGVKPVKGSGNQWTAQLDVADTHILASLKHTDKESFRMHKGLMKEAQDAINGPGGVGGDAIPAVAVSVQGEAFVALRAEDFLRLIQSEQAQYVIPSRASQKRSRAKMPNLLREEKHDTDT